MALSGHGGVLGDVRAVFPTFPQDRANNEQLTHARLETASSATHYYWGDADCLRASVDGFIARENIRLYRRELENGVGETMRPTVLKLLVEEEDRFGHTREELHRLDRHIARLSEIMARHVELMDKLQSNGSPLRRAPLVLATLHDVMAAYLEHRQRIVASLADGRGPEA